MDEEVFSIQLKIAGKTFPLTCKRSEEALIRKAASNVDDKLLKYSSAYSAANLTREDLLTMVAYHFSVESLCIRENEDMIPWVNTIGQLNKELEQYLNT